MLEVILERVEADPKLLPATCILVSGRTSVSSEDASTAATMPGGQKDVRKLLELRCVHRLAFRGPASERGLTPARPADCWSGWPR